MQVTEAKAEQKTWLFRAVLAQSFLCPGNLTEIVVYSRWYSKYALSILTDEIGLSEADWLTSDGILVTSLYKQHYSFSDFSCVTLGASAKSI